MARAPPELSFNEDMYFHYLARALDIILSDEVDHLIHPEEETAIVHSRLYRRIQLDYRQQTQEEREADADRKKSLKYILHQDIANGLTPTEELIDNAFTVGQHKHVVANSVDLQRDLVTKRVLFSSFLL